MGENRLGHVHPAIAQRVGQRPEQEPRFALLSVRPAFCRAGARRDAEERPLAPQKPRVEASAHVMQQSVDEAAVAPAL